MEPFLGGGEGSQRYGNPSGSHSIARDAVRALDEARERIAEALGCRVGEVVFTSGGTEADNLAVTGGMPPRSGSPVCSAVEHPAVLEPTRALGGSTVGVDRFGRVDPAELARALSESDRPSVVSVMTANNELGTVNDIDAVAAVRDEHAPGVPLHTDAVQAAAWLDLPVRVAAADMVSVSAHKLGGPKGVGALVVRDGVQVSPLLRGGGQERGRRGGTSNVAGIVGFAAALSASVRDRRQRAERVAALRDDMARRLVCMDGVEPTVDDPSVEVLPGHCHLLVRGVVGEELLLLLEYSGVCASAASSCASGAVGGSHVVEAIGAVDPDVAPLRLTLGADTTPADVDATVDALADAIRRTTGARAGTP